MRLTKIQLAGFKSFVDPTTFHVPGQLLAVLGPNGCGKSNIIDAVRWVMGESAASQLRGDSMEDVIFNGSVNRKPVGQASVELVFDNSEGRLEGAWGRYAEVAVKRVVTRGAQSTYYINNTRCRRRDIAAIFLGTGLGPRSYAIIEQGTISRIIESKPDELRVFFEEAAGISKYKERRRETANRIRHTMDNLDRLNDLRAEQQKQLAHLQRQARNAEKYKQLRAEERTLKAQLLGLRWQALNDNALSQEKLIRERETQLEALLAEQRRLEAAQAAGRARQTGLADTLESAQQKHYQVGAEIARAEQTLEHRRQLRERRRDEQSRIEQGLAQVAIQSETDGGRLAELLETLAEGELSLAQAEEIASDAGERLQTAEQELADWQVRWDEFSRRAGDAQRGADVERARIEQLERQQLQSRQRVDRLQAEQQAFNASAADGEAQLVRFEQAHTAAAAALQQRQQALTELSDRLEQQTARQRELIQTLSECRERQQTGRGRLSSLQTLQEAALSAADGDSERALGDWLQRQGLQEAPRLAERLRVEPGWETAVEAVLGADLASLWINDGTTFDAAAVALTELRQGGVSLSDGSAVAMPTTGRSDRLAVKLNGSPAPAGLLDQVGIAADLDDALARRAGLRDGESLVTPDGIQVGRGWLRRIIAADASGADGAGLLARGREIEQLQAELSELSESIDQLQHSLTDAEQAGDQLERERQQAQTAATAQQREVLQAETQWDALRERLQQQRQRQTDLQSEFDEQRHQLEQSQAELVAARERQEQAVAAMSRHAVEREQMEHERERRRTTLVDLRASFDEVRSEAQRQALAAEAARSESAALEQALVRLGEQRERLLAARTQLQLDAEEGGDANSDTNTDSDNDAGLRQQLETLLAERVRSDQALSEARAAAEAQSAELRQLEQSLTELAQRQQRERDVLGERRLSNSEVSVRRQTLRDQLLEMGLTVEGVIEQLPEEASEDDWQQQLEKTSERIQRLGAINLAAIEEFGQLSERAEYLEAQHNDLIEALSTLETAMSQIDQETRSRFQETFDQVNSGLQELFPRLFGGGRAYLDLTSADALEAGVTIMAHPPGKRNGTIHLLSGGEKALTAVALIFSIFQLTPAPFCMLDEVDAPLDDANVGRFGELLKEMSSRVQLIVVTHNKGTMEVAAQLAGVTMQEPGVSRLVAVDIDEAVRLAGA